MFNLLLEKAITPPSLDGFNDGSILENIGKFLDFIFTFFANIVTALTNFYSTLVEINGYVIELGDSAKSGITNGLPILDSVGLYRYLMGDPVFYFTYILVFSGCLFTIYKLVLLLVKIFKQLKDNINSNGKTKNGIIYYLSKFLN